MIVVSNYPQVPISTSNVATDTARVDNQLKAVIIPPKEVTKGHEERAFNAQNERTAESAQQQARLLEGNQQQVQEKQQQNQKQSQQQQQDKSANPVAAEAVATKNLKIPPRSQPALQRKDIRLKVESNTVNMVNTPVNDRRLGRQPLTDQEPIFYQQVGMRIEQFYQQQILPNSEPEMSAWI